MTTAHLLTTGGDLPIPAWLFAWGASIILVVSFFGLAAAWRKPKFGTTEWRPVAPGASRILLSKPARLLYAATGIFLLSLVIYSGLAGAQSPARNFSVTFVFVTVWIGMPVASALFGNFYPAFDPWSNLAKGAGSVYVRLTGSDPRHMTYPDRLGRWPAAVSLVAFVWLEIIYGTESGGAVLTPQLVGTATVAYSVLTLSMMALFGIRQWSRNGELFSVLFSMYAGLSAFEIRGNRFGRRRALSGTTVWSGRHGSAALALAAIAGTTYDGAQQRVLSGARDSFSGLVEGLGPSERWSAWLTDTTLLLLTIAIVAAVYGFGLCGMRRVPKAPEFGRLRVAFSHTLIPIALAYMVAHYFSYFFEGIQRQATFLISDPLGRGWDLIGLTDVQVGTGLISTSVLWYLQLAALLAGHVVGLMLAHDRSLQIWSDVRSAAQSQYWMLVVMLLLTVFGLYLLSSVDV